MSMYRARRMSKPGFGGRPRNGGGRSRFGRGKPAGLDPSLFVKKATAAPVQDGPVLSKTTFNEYALDNRIKANIAHHGYVHPTAIQEQSLPHILEGRDLIGIANTGTGKTAAFLLGLIHKCIQNQDERVLIVAPTRELAIQIKDEFVVFSRGLHMGAVIAVGGTNIDRQMQGLRRRPQFVIGTPGRLKDLIERRALSLSSFHNIVLDEVDRMVDMGFINDIKYLLALLPEDRQSLFFTATMDRRSREILNKFVHEDPITVSVKQQATSENVDQDVVKVPFDKKKIDVLKELLQTPGFEKVMVFGRTKRGVEMLSRQLHYDGFRTAAIHGDKAQNQRLRALQAFKENRVNVLIATDVAARGIDVKGVTHVINYDQPESYDDYVHRIGRTGRAGQKGYALTFVE